MGRHADKPAAPPGTLWGPERVKLRNGERWCAVTSKDVYGPLIFREKQAGGTYADSGWFVASVYDHGSIYRAAFETARTELEAMRAELAAANARVRTAAAQGEAAVIAANEAWGRSVELLETAHRMALERAEQAVQTCEAFLQGDDAASAKARDENERDELARLRRRLVIAGDAIANLRARIAADASADPGTPSLDDVAAHEASGGLWRIVSYYPPQRPFAHLAQLRVVDGAIEATSDGANAWEPLAHVCNVVFAEPVLTTREPMETPEHLAERCADASLCEDAIIRERDGQWRDIRAAERVLQTQLAAQRSEATRQLHQAIAKYKARAEAAAEARRVARTAEVAAKTERNRLAGEVERLTTVARKLVDVALRRGRGTDLEAEALGLADQIEATPAE